MDRLLPIGAALLATAALATGCAGAKETGATVPESASLAPADAIAFATITTDADSEQWRQADEVLSRVPALRDGVGRDRREGGRVGRSQGGRFRHGRSRLLRAGAAGGERGGREQCDTDREEAGHAENVSARPAGDLTRGQSAADATGAWSSGMRLASAIASAAGLASLSRFGRGIPAAIHSSISWKSSSINVSEATFLRTRPCA